MGAKHKLPPWLRRTNSSRGPNVGVSWYTEEEWAKVKAAAVDPERFEATYSEWLQVAEDALLKLRAMGIDAHKSYIQASELLAWCLAHGKRNDGAARAQFVSKQGRKSNEGSA